MTNIEKQFVPYEQSLKLKCLGFDEECFGYTYTENYLKGQLVISNDIEDLAKNSDGDYYVTRPTWSQIVDWFLDKYNYTSHIYRSLTMANKFSFDISHDRARYSHTTSWRDTREEARIACLDKLIELCQKNESVKEQEVEENIIPISTNEMKCVECNFLPAKYDYNGCGHWVCKPCGDSLEKEFEEEYR